MEEISKINTYNEVIKERFKRVIDQKTIENTEAAGMLTELEKSWDEINKNIGEEIRTELDLVTEDERTVARSKELLKRNRCIVDKKNAFAIAGKVTDKHDDPKEDVGLPNLLVKLFVRKEREEQLIKETETNSYGNFKFIFNPEETEKLSGTNQYLFKIYSDEETFIHTEDLKIAVKPEKTEEVIIKIFCGEEQQDRVNAGKTLRNSIEREAEYIQLKSGNIKTASITLQAISRINLDELRVFKEELSASPPVFINPETKVPEVMPEEPAHPELPNYNEWVIQGRIVWKRMREQGGRLMVKAFDKDRIIDDLLGAEFTDEKGFYKIIYKTQTFREGREPGPDVYLMVLDLSGKQLYSTEEKIKFDADGNVEINIEIPDKDEKKKPPVVQKLEDIKEIGTEGAEKLRKENINDIPSFIKAKERTLKRILGEVNIRKIKNDIKKKE